MGQPFPLDTSWEYGMRRDFARDGMPAGSAWNIVNLIPNELQAPLRKRGGWTYVGGAMGGVTQMTTIVNAPFSAGTQLLGIDQGGVLWDIDAVTSPGTVYLGAQNPFFYRDKVIFPNSDGTTAIKYYDGSSVAALTGSFTGKYGGVFKDHAVLACSDTYPQRLAFSNAADPTTWDLTLQVWDASFPLKGLGFLRTGILLFEESGVEIIRGSVPPPGGDFSMSPLYQAGCLDAQSIVNWGDSVIWCSAEGVFQTDGATVADLTKIGGMSNYWRDTFLASYASTYHLVSGVYRNHLIISLLNASYVEQDTLVFDLVRRVWWRFSNFPMAGATQVHTAPEEMYISVGARVAKVSTCWAPAAANKNDGDGTAVTWTLESKMHRGFTRLHRRYIIAQAKQTWRSLYPIFDMRDAASDNPSIRISVIGTPEDTTYTDATGGSLPPDLTETSEWTRVRRLINFPANGLAYKMVQSNASSDTRIYAVEAEYAGREGSRVGNG